MIVELTIDTPLLADLVDPAAGESLRLALTVLFRKWASPATL